MSLEEVRTQIDAIDAQIVELLGARQQLVFQAATYKRNPDEVRAPKRREQMMIRLHDLSLQHGVEPTVVERVYTAMIDEFIELEQRRHQTLTATD